jgi:AAHS family 4-hydroxybenzoate transporter-like MFS transporter
MTANGALQLAVYLVVLLALAKPLGAYMARVYEGRGVGLDRVLGWLERLLYRLSGVRPDREMGWKTYAFAMLLFNFAGLLVVYLLSNWMPTLIQQSGLSLRGASLITATFQLGGTAGAVALGRLMYKFNPYRILGVAYLMAAGFVTLMGAAAAIPWLMTAAVFGAGFCVSGGQVGANALTAAFYPTSCRTTGVSWALGFGRSGSIVGSLMGGVMLGQGWTLGTVYGVVAIPAVISGVSIVALGVRSSR